MKHFAAHVEDHPLAYGDFEGNIPKGEYGGGSVMLWDRGTFELIGDESGDAQIARGDLKFELHGEKLTGTWALVHMKGRGEGKNKEMAGCYQEEGRCARCRVGYRAVRGAV